MNRRIQFIRAMVVCCASLISLPAQAEHRVALLVGISQYDDASLATEAKDLSALAAALDQRGFRCATVENPDEEKLKGAIEHFAETTPTLGTALIFFNGQVLTGSYKGKPGVCLLGADSKPGRGYLLDEAFEQIHSRGGSELNLIIIDSPTSPSSKIRLPQGCLLAYSGATDFIDQLRGDGDFVARFKSGDKAVQSNLEDGVTVSGARSFAIASPDKFMPGKKAGDEWVNGRGMVFCWCPPGRYVKGSPTNEPGRYPDEVQKEVIVDEGFWISKYEMTLRENPRGGRPHRTIALHKNDPLTMVNYDDARNMTQRTLTESERQAGRLASDWQYSLTTENEWEYAARAGTTTAWSFGDDVNLLPLYANFADKAFYDTGDIFSNYAHRTLSDGSVKLARVGSYRPNPWGIHDMHGNVAEWCMGTAIRGGSWASTPASCRSAYRHTFSSRDEQNFIGYRIVIEKVSSAKPQSTATK